MVGFCQIHLVLRLRCQAFRRNLDKVQKTERIHSHPSLRPLRIGCPGLEPQTRRIPCLGKRHEIVGAVSGRNRVRHVHQSLACLSNRHVGDHSIREGVYDSGLHTVL